MIGSQDWHRILYNKLLEGHGDIFECRAEYVDLILADLVKILMKFKLWELIIFMLFQVVNGLKDITDMEEQMSKLMEILELTQEDYDERAKIAKYIQVKVTLFSNQAKIYFIFSISECNL